jgi:hypothetical protein
MIGRIGGHLTSADIALARKPLAVASHAATVTNFLDVGVLLFPP